MQLRLLIVIPHFNHHSSCQEVVRACLEKYSFPVWVIDDGSNPEFEFLNEPRLRIVRFEKNEGKGRGLRWAFNEALKEGFTHVLSLDADGQHPPKEIQKLLDAALQNPFSLIIGKRDLSSADVPEISRFGRKFSNFWTWIETGKKIEDSQSGFRIYPLFCLQMLRLNKTRFDFEIEVLVRMIWAGVSVCEVDVECLYLKGEMRISHFDKFWDNVRISLLNTRLVLLSLISRRRKLKPEPLWTGEIRGGSGNQFLKFWIKRGGLKVCRFFLLFIVPYFYFFAPKAKKASAEYWKALRPSASWIQRQIDIAKHFYTFGVLLLDRLALSLSAHPRFPAASNGFENVSQEADKNRGLVVVGAHFGSWMIKTFYMDRHRMKKPMTLLEIEPKGMSFNKLSPDDSVRGAERLFLNHTEKPIFHFRDLLDQGQCLGLMGDRLVSTRFELVSFLGKLIPVETSFYEIVGILNTPVAFAFGGKEQKDEYSFFAFPLSARLENLSKEERAYDIAVNYAERLEQMVRRYPYQWFNFFPIFSNFDHLRNRNPKHIAWARPQVIGKSALVRPSSSSPSSANAHVNSANQISI